MGLTNQLSAVAIEYFKVFNGVWCTSIFNYHFDGETHDLTMTLSILTISDKINFNLKISPRHAGNGDKSTILKIQLL